METCYRHSDRETGVACSNCGRPICPDCMTSTSVGMRCPECSKQKTKVKTIGSGSDPTLTYILIGINVAIGLGALLGGGSGGSDALLEGNPFADEGAVSRVAIADGEYWRLVTSGFLHSGVLHLALNMVFLYFLGSQLEPELGRLRFAMVYGVSLLGGGFGALLLQPVGSTLGASGAVFGLMGAALVVMRVRGIGLMESQIGLLIILNLVLSLRPGISLGGHLGGLVAGALATLILLQLREKVRIPAAAPVLLAGAVGLAAIVGAIAVSGSATA